MTAQTVLTQLRPKSDWLSLQLVDVVERCCKVEWIDILKNNRTIEKVPQYVLKSLPLAFHCALYWNCNWKIIGFLYCQHNNLHCVIYSRIKFPMLGSYIKNHMLQPTHIIFKWYLFKNRERYWHDIQCCEIYNFHFLCLLACLIFWCDILIVLPAHWV